MFGSIQAGIGVAVLVAMLGMGAIIKSKNSTIEDQMNAKATLIAQCSVKDLEIFGLNAAIEAQNANVQILKDKDEELQVKINGQTIVIDRLKRAASINVASIDNEVVGKTPEASMDWLLKKALGVEE